MGHNGIEASHCASAMVEIKIKTLDFQTYTLRVDKCVPVPALKEQIATITGIDTEQQCLICDGRILEDDQLLSAYHAEHGHTLHLVVRQPIPPLPESSTSNTEADPALRAGDSQGSQGSVDYSVLGFIGLAVLVSLGTSNTEGGVEGIDATGTLHERLSQSSGLSNARNTSNRPSVAGNAADQTTIPLTSSQSAVLPDTLTTLSEYLNQLRQEFAANDSGSTTGETRILRPSHLAAVVQSTRQLLIGEVSDSLSILLMFHLVNDTNPPTPANMIRSGSLLEILGISLLELGRATTMLRLGQTPDDAVVNTGPAVSMPLGTSFRSLQAGTAHSSPVTGESLASGPRNIESRIRSGPLMPASEDNQREESSTQQSTEQSIPSAPSSNTDPAPSMGGPSDPPRNPAVRSELVSSGERSYNELDGVHQPVAESSRLPQRVDAPGTEGDSNPGPGGRGLSESRNGIHHFLRPVSRRENVQNGSSPSASASAETNEAVADGQAEPLTGTTNDGNFIATVHQQIMPIISQQEPSSGSAEYGSVHGSSRGEEEGGDSSGRHEPPLP